MKREASKKLPKSRVGNPLQLREVPKTHALPKSGRVVSIVKPSDLPWWKRLNPFRKRRFKFSWKKLFIFLGVCAVLLIATVAGIFAYYVRFLPNPHELSTLFVPQSTKIYDRNGTLIYTFHGEYNRTIVPDNQISPYLKDATVAVENASFYTDDGVDISGILRAVRNRITHQGLTGGGSTITQQYIKNTIGTNDDTISRKIKEAILAIEVTKDYSKDDILTGYLNQISYGSNFYGIEAASEGYFGVHAKDLTLSQAATLAALPEEPSVLSPYGDNLNQLFARKNYILDRMVATGFITQAQDNAAKLAAPTLNNPNFNPAASSLIAPQFVFYIRDQLLNYLGGDTQQTEQELDEQGYDVTTSLDLPTQEMAQQVLETMGPGVVKRYNATNASLTAVDPKTGQILAMVGSIDYSNSISGNTNFATALLQPGSSFKPFVYATAFSPKFSYSPSSNNYDLVTNFGTTASPYAPTDYNGSCEFCGPVTDRNALDNSLNIPAVANLDQVGVQNAMNTAKAMGITTLNQPASSYGLSLVLGSGEVTGVDMANAYGTFADGGIAHQLVPILNIKKNGVVVKDFTKSNPGVKAIEPDVAYEISNVLSDNNARAKVFGTHTPLVVAGHTVAAKTGTTDNFRDTWTVGYTPSISVAIWVGNNNPGKHMVTGADGVVTAAPMFGSFMTQYLKGKPDEPFTEPSDIKTISVDQLSGKLPTSQTPASDIISDIFAPWQVPTTSDDVHVQVNIDKNSGLLATSLTPVQDVISQTFFNVHSNMPNNPNWEGPVQAWAKANGGGTNPPTQSDNVHTAANAPTISITSPVDGSAVSGSITITINPGGTEPISQVVISINGQAVGTLTQAPWTLTYDTSTLPAGTSQIQATVTNSIDMAQSAQISVTSQGTSAPPDPVISPSATNGSKSLNKPITLTWTNPTTANLANVNIYQSNTTDPTDLGVKIGTVTATPGSPGTYSVTSSALTVGQTYYFIIRSVNSAGVENQSSLKLPAELLP